MCRKAPYPRCSNHARLSLQKAVASGDPERIEQARHNWRLSPAGLKELEGQNPSLAAEYATKRAALIERAARPVRVGLDIDNTSGDFTDGLRQHVLRVTGRDPQLYPDPEHYSLVDSNWFSSKEEFLSHFQESERQGIYRRMRAFDGLKKNVQRLIADGAEIHIVTARNQAWEADTRDWLRRTGIPFHSITFTDSKEKLDHVDVYLDDADYQLEKLEKHGKKVVAFDQLYNRHLSHMPRVKHWDDVPAMIKKVAATRS